MNEYVAVVVDELYELGIREVVLSPGSRSTPLSMMFCEYSKYEVFLNIDERSAAFFALGIAKEQNRPVVLVCTSGSAAAHYFPAVVEAKYSRIPLIILTADRPPELQNIGAPQTIDQNRIYGNFINYYGELSPSGKEDYIYQRVVIRKAYLKCNDIPKGPVHINVPLQEPLVPQLDRKYFDYGKCGNSFKILAGVQQINFDISSIYEKNGIIVCGPDSSLQFQPEILALGETLNAPVLADPLSNIRSYESDVIVDSYDAFLKYQNAITELKPDYIIMFGQPPVSKRLHQFLLIYRGVLCFQVDPASEYRDPSQITTQYVKADIKEFIRQIDIMSKDNRYLKKWIAWQKKMQNKLERVLLESDMFEGKIIRLIQTLMPKDSRIVAANSMAIRDMDYFWRSGKSDIKILCNRGTNGIDGTISTALGIATAGKTTVLLTGDLAFFHDMNGLLIGKTHHLQLVIVLINNDGGGIFQYLPQKGEKFFDYLFTTSHGIDFQGAEQLYNVRYHKAENYKDFEECFAKALISKEVCVIEIRTDKEKSWKLHEKYTSV